MKRIDATTRQKVIELHKEGKEIKEIPQILNNANIKISYGSVWNIVEALRSQCKASEPSNQVDQSPSSVSNSTVPDDLIRDHSSISSSAVDSKSGPSGCPLSRFIPQEEIPEINDSDLEDSKGSLSIPQEKKAINYDQPTIKNTITNDPYMENIDILDADSESDIYTDPNVDYDEEFDGIKGERRFNYQYPNTFPTFPRRVEIPSADNDYDNRVVTKTKEIEKHSEQLYRVPPRISQSEDSSLGLGIDWDKNHQARFVKWVMDQKRIRHDEERKLQKQWNIHIQERNTLEELKRDFELREAKLSEVKDLIPSAKELKEIGIHFSQANAWLEAIKGKAEQEGLDLRTAAWELVSDLKNWELVGGLRKVIQQQKQQLNLLRLATDQQKQAIGIIVDLKKSGMTDEDISNLVKVVSKWSSKVGQGNGSSFELDSRLNLLPHSTCELPFYG